MKFEKKEKKKENIRQKQKKKMTSIIFLVWSGCLLHLLGGGKALNRYVYVRFVPFLIHFLLRKVSSR